MRTTLLLFVICLVTACGGSKTESTSNDLLNNYLTIKDALVATDYSATQKAANEMLKSEHPDQLKGSLMTIANSSDIDGQRAAFENLSKAMYELVSERSSNESIIYKQHCPMAFNNKGAYWLSTEKEIMNPYFGDMMLHCGSVQETIQ